MSEPKRSLVGGLLPLLPLLLILACSDRGAPADPVVARIDGEPVLLSEIERRAAWRLHRARLDVHLVLERETEQLIEEWLLERAASERGIDADSLLRDSEAGAATVSESDVDRYLAEHPADVPDAQARPRIRHYLEETRRIERRLAFVASLRAAADVEILLEAPPRPRSVLDLRGAPSRGAKGAPATIVHFADLSAADSARSAHHLATLEREHPGSIRILHRSLPVERDELGLRTAQLAAAAQARGLFWALHDQLVAAGGVDRQADLDTIARAVDLEDLLPTLAGDRESLLRVKQDLDHARNAGVRRAPTLFVNGRYFMGLDGYDALRELVLEELEGEPARSR